jgi:uncharacterized damage-inducible protein DinB
MTASTAARSGLAGLFRRPRGVLRPGIRARAESPCCGAARACENLPAFAERSALIPHMEEIMKRMLVGLAAVALVALSVPREVRADETPSGIKGAIIGNLMMAAQEVEELAAAMPDSKYGWRPGKGVRSVGEVYLHICQGNYLLPMQMGIEPPMPKDQLMGMDKMKADKAAIAQMLKDSYAYASKVISEMPESEYETKVDFFGNQMSKLSVMMVMASHSHEHLGQAIAYARMNGVVPPWTARQQAEAAKKARPAAPASRNPGRLDAREARAR